MSSVLSKLHRINAPLGRISCHQKKMLCVADRRHCFLGRNVLAFKLVLIILISGSANIAFAGIMTIDDGGFEGLSAIGFAPNAPDTLIRGAWTLQNQARISASLGNPGQAMALESNGLIISDPLIFQDVTGLTPGTTYEVDWDLRVKVNFGGSFGNGPSFGVFLDSLSFSSALYLGGTLSASYVPLSTAFVATSSTHRLFFAGELDNRTNGAGNTDVSYFLDNVTFSASPAAVPEPAGLTVFGVGIGCLAGFYRRRVVSVKRAWAFSVGLGRNRTGCRDHT